MKVTQQQKLIVIDGCSDAFLDSLNSLAYSNLSGDGALLIHTDRLAIEPGVPLPAEEFSINVLVDLIKDVGGAQIGYGANAIPDTFILLKRG